MPLTLQDCSDFVGTRQQSPCRVTCKNGVVLEADCVLVTASLGFLQENLDDFFRPQLPEWKISAIKGWAIGTVDKIFLEFEDLDFLPDQVNSLQLIWRTCDADQEEPVESSWFKKIHNIYLNSMEPKPTLCSKYSFVASYQNLPLLASKYDCRLLIRLSPSQIIRRL